MRTKLVLHPEISFHSDSNSSSSIPTEAQVDCRIIGTSRSGWSGGLVSDVPLIKE